MKARDLNSTHKQNKTPATKMSAYYASKEESLRLIDRIRTFVALTSLPMPMFAEYLRIGTRAYATADCNDKALAMEIDEVLLYMKDHPTGVVPPAEIPQFGKHAVGQLIPLIDRLIDRNT